MKDQIILSSISIDQLKSVIADVVQEGIRASQSREEAAKFLSIAETCKLFKPSISRGTLHNWTKGGVLKSYPIGGKVFYKYSEILESMGRIKKYQRQPQVA